MIEMFLHLDQAIARDAAAWRAARPEAAEFVEFLIHLPDIKGLPIAMLFWGLWFTGGERRPERRVGLFAILLMSVIALFTGRALADALPFRARPMASEDVMGEAARSQFLDYGSAMPSDHAVFFFAVAGGFYMISKPAGLLVLLHSAIIVCVPRVLSGRHFAGDIVVGALIGTAIAILLLPLIWRALNAVGTGRLINWLDLRWPQLAYPALFFATFQIAVMAYGLRELAVRL